MTEEDTTVIDKTIEGADVYLLPSTHNAHNARVLDIITSASMYRVAQERREVSQGTRETAGLVNTPEPAKNP